MEKFDIEKFKKIKLIAGEAFVTEDNNFVTLSENEENFQQDIIKSNSPIQQSKLFYKDTLSLKKEAEFFQGFAIGVHKRYDEKGELIEEIDHDLPFTFSLEDVRQKILSEFGKDIMDAGLRFGISRSTNPAPHYIVVIPLTNLPKGESKLLKINGETGEVAAVQILRFASETDIPQKYTE